MKEFKVVIPEGYEIDEELSTFENIIFKKKEFKLELGKDYVEKDLGKIVIDRKGDLGNYETINIKKDWNWVVSDILECEGYQFVTQKQYETLPNVPKINVIGIFWDDDGGIVISKYLQYHSESIYPHRDANMTGWQNFQPITDLSDSEIMKK